MYPGAATGIMIVITLVVTITMLVPTIFKFGSSLVRFYWRGFWVFLAIISFIAFGAATLEVAGYSILAASAPLLDGLVFAFMAFVMFGWFRLAGSAVRNRFQWFIKRPHATMIKTRAD